MDDRRRHQRAGVPGEVADASEELGGSAMLVDVSEGGLRLMVEGPVPLGTEVQLRLEFVDCDVPIQVLAQVVWCRQSPPYEVGVRFLELEPEHRHRLSGLVGPN